MASLFDDYRFDRFLRYAELVEWIEQLLADLTGADDVLDGPARRKLGQLAGSASVRFADGTSGTPDRTSCSWLVRSAAGTSVTVTIRHQRAGSRSIELGLVDASSSADVT